MSLYISSIPCKFHHSSIHSIIFLQITEMSSKRVLKQSKLIRYIRGPFRVLARVGDLYVRSLTGGGANIINYGNAMGCPITTLPQMQSLSTSSSPSCRIAEKELRDPIIRFASTRNRAGKVDAAELRHSKRSFPLGGGGGAAVQFERIDEEKAFEFGKEDNWICIRHIRVM